MLEIFLDVTTYLNNIRNNIRIRPLSIHTHTYIIIAHSLAYNIHVNSIQIIMFSIVVHIVLAKVGLTEKYIHYTIWKLKKRI